MKFSQELERSLNARDLNGIRAALIGYLDIGSDSNVVLVADEINNQLKSSGMELFDPDDGRNVTSSASMPREALRSIKVALRLNFSKEKIRKGAELKWQVENSDERSDGSRMVTASKVFDVSAPQSAQPAGTKNNDEEIVVPAELREAVFRGETSSVKSILIGCLDVFDKTEVLPVIEFAAYCKDNLEKKGIQLFAEDDKSIDFSAMPLTAETLRILKAKLRLNFSLEKMIFAEKIFQQELAKKLQQKPVPALQQKSVTEQPRQTTAQELKPEVEQPCQAVPQQKPVAEQPRQTAQAKPVAEQPHQTAPQQRPVAEQPRPKYRPHINASASKPNAPENKVKIEVIYKPGPLEHLFGQVGKFFDSLFNQKGKRIERPYHGRK